METQKEARARFEAREQAEEQRAALREPLTPDEAARRGYPAAPSLLEQLATANVRADCLVRDLPARYDGWNWHADTVPSNRYLFAAVQFAVRRRGFTGVGKKLISKIVSRIVARARARGPAPTVRCEGFHFRQTCPCAECREARR